MNPLSKAIWFFGASSLATGGTLLTSTVVTYHPSIQPTAHQFMAITFGLWAMLALITVGLSLSAVALAQEPELIAARSVRRRGLWLSLPQIVLFGLFLVAGLSLA